MLRGKGFILGFIFVLLIAAYMERDNEDISYNVVNDIKKAKGERTYLLNNL